MTIALDVSIYDKMRLWISLLPLTIAGYDQIDQSSRLYTGDDRGPCKIDIIIHKQLDGAYGLRSV